MTPKTLVLCLVGATQLLVIACVEDFTPPQAPPCKHWHDCEGLSADMDRLAQDSGRSWVCAAGRCALDHCPNGAIDHDDEECDDGNRDDGDGCSSECRNSRCGDGILRSDKVPGATAYESCDDGNAEDGDACPSNCLVARCGDGFLRLGLPVGHGQAEACDDGNEIDDDACTTDCQWARCGDGITREDLTEREQGYEACDDGNLDDTDSCIRDCKAAVCGDGHLRVAEEGQPDEEQCDDGNLEDFDGCDANCRIEKCKDGSLDPGEECDDDNFDDEDGCRNNCMIAVCGDGVRRTDLLPQQAGYEECDDGNQLNSDACLSDCAVARCGDEVVHEGVETCDDGNEEDLDACRNTCELAFCGDGVVRTDGVEEAGGELQPLEECDPPEGVEDPGCVAASCSYRCNSQIQGVEPNHCDDRIASLTACVDHHCQPVACREDAHCPEHIPNCVDNECRAAEVGSECDAHAHCGNTSAVCIANPFGPQGEWWLNWGGRCGRPTTVTCLDDADCLFVAGDGARQYVCSGDIDRDGEEDLGLTFPRGICRIPAGSDSWCINDFDCASGANCYQTEAGNRCYEPECGTGDDPQEHQNDCALGQVCDRALDACVDCVGRPGEFCNGGPNLEAGGARCFSLQPGNILTNELSCLPIPQDQLTPENREASSLVPRIASDPVTGWVFAVWQACGDAGCTGSRIFAARGKNDEGRILWTAPICISCWDGSLPAEGEAERAATSQGHDPDLHVNGGYVHIVWSDTGSGVHDGDDVWEDTQRVGARDILYRRWCPGCEDENLSAITVVSSSAALGDGDATKPRISSARTWCHANTRDAVVVYEVGPFEGGRSSEVFATRLCRDDWEGHDGWHPRGAYETVMLSAGLPPSNGNNEGASSPVIDGTSIAWVDDSNLDGDDNVDKDILYTDHWPLWRGDDDQLVYAEGDPLLVNTDCTGDAEAPAIDHGPQKYVAYTVDADCALPVVGSSIRIARLSGGEEIERVTVTDDPAFAEGAIAAYNVSPDISQNSIEVAVAFSSRANLMDEGSDDDIFLRRFTHDLRPSAPNFTLVSENDAENPSRQPTIVFQSTAETRPSSRVHVLWEQLDDGEVPDHDVKYRGIDSLLGPQACMGRERGDGCYYEPLRGPFGEEPGICRQRNGEESLACDLNCYAATNDADCPEGQACGGFAVPWCIDPADRTAACEGAEDWAGCVRDDFAEGVCITLREGEAAVCRAFCFGQEDCPEQDMECTNLGICVNEAEPGPEEEEEEEEEQGDRAAACVDQDQFDRCDRGNEDEVGICGFGLDPELLLCFVDCFVVHCPAHLNCDDDGFCTDENGGPG